MVLLLGDRRGEHFHFVGELDGLRKGVPDPFGQTHLNVSFVSCSGPGCGLPTGRPVPTSCRSIEWPVAPLAPPAWLLDATTLRLGSARIARRLGGGVRPSSAWGLSPYAP